MHVARQTDDVIELEHVPAQWIIGLGAVWMILLIGLLKALVEFDPGGIVIVLAMIGVLSWIMVTRIVRRLRVVADRATNTLRISATTLRGEGSAHYPLSALLRAEVETRHDRATSRPEPSLVLVMSDSDSPRRLRLDPFKPDPADLLHASERINAWLATGEAPPELIQTMQETQRHESREQYRPGTRNPG